MQHRLQHRSYSQFHTWASVCRWATKLGRVDNLVGTPAAWTEAGSAFHDAIQLYEESHRTMTTRAVQDAFLASYDERIELAHRIEPDTSLWLRGGRTATETDVAKRRALGLEQIETYMVYVAREGLMPALIDGNPAVELSMSVDAGEFEIVCRADLVLVDSTGKLLIRDLKTGKRPDWPLQLILYGYAFEETYGRKVWWGDYYLAKLGQATAPIDLTEIPKAEIIRWFVAMDAEERAGHYWPNPTNCFTCEFKHQCQFFLP